jgi:tetratricopeptide (TPR) repeat protein
MTQLAIPRDDIYEWSNLGIRHLEANRLDDSISCFRVALSLAKARVIQVAPRPLGNRMTNPSSNDRGARQPVAFQETGIEENRVSCSRPLMSRTEDQTGESNKFLYLHPRPLSPLGCQEPQPAIASICVTCLFNLAVAMHLKCLSVGTEAKSNPDERLTAVAQLYDHVYHVLLSHDTAADWNTSADLALILAALNNLAVLQSELDRHDQAKACFETLLANVMCMKLCGGYEALRSDPSLLPGVFSNIVRALNVLTEPICAPGA